MKDKATNKNQIIPDRRPGVLQVPKGTNFADLPHDVRVAAIERVRRAHTMASTAERQYIFRKA